MSDFSQNDQSIDRSPRWLIQHKQAAQAKASRSHHSYIHGWEKSRPYTDGGCLYFCLKERHKTHSQQCTWLGPLPLCQRTNDFGGRALGAAAKTVTIEAFLIMPSERHLSSQPQGEQHARTAAAGGCRRIVQEAAEAATKVVAAAAQTADTPQAHLHILPGVVFSFAMATAADCAAILPAA